MHAPKGELKRRIKVALKGETRRRAIVYYHVDQKPGHLFMKLQGGFNGDYTPIIARSVREAKKHHPEALIVMLTDFDTQFQDLGITIIRLPVWQERIMYERSRCQQAFAEVWDAEALHIDTDVMINRRFDEVFDKDFDVGVTFRTDFPDMPYNGGMLLCKTARPFAHFMGDLIKMHKAIAVAGSWSPYDFRCFRGQQLALTILLHSRTPYTAPEPWGKIGVFSAHMLNRPVDADSNDGTDPFAYHFKGGRKVLLTKGIV